MSPRNGLECRLSAVPWEHFIFYGCELVHKTCRVQGQPIVLVGITGRIKENLTSTGGRQARPGEMSNPSQ